MALMIGRTADGVSKELLVGADGSLSTSSGGPSGDTFESLGFEQITDLAASTALTVPSGARFALIQAEAQAIRWRDDGTAPTASIGVNLPADSDIWFSGDLAAFRAIEVEVGAILNVSYYG